MGESTRLPPTTRILQESNKGTTIGHMANHGNMSQIGNQTINNYHSKKSIDNEIESFCKWLSPLDFSASHERIRDKITSGTGQWFINSEYFISWRIKRTRNLWCYGKPGTGKSSIASIVVEQIRHQAESQVAFLYLSYRESPSVENLLGCVAGQLLRQTNNSPCAKELLVNRMSSPPGVKQLTDLLSKLASASTFLVVDALDEFDTSQSETLVGILQGTKANLFITSRNKPAQGFKELAVEAHEEDIRHYIQERCQQNNRLIKMIERDPSLEQELRNAITSKAAGIFLLAYFHVEAVLGLQVLTASEVRKALKELPSRRDSMYEKTLERIKAQDKTRSTHAMRTIGWIIHAHKPLTIQELRHALLIQEINDSNNDSQVDIFLDHGALLQDTDILEFCHGLVEVDKKTTAVRFIHFSALEYFNSATVREKEFPTFYSQMALACTTYLCLTRLEDSETGEETVEYFDDKNSYREEFLESRPLVEKSPGFISLGRKTGVVSTRRWESCEVREQISKYSNDSGVAKQLSPVMKYLLYPFAVHAGENLDTYFKATNEPSRSNVEDQLRILFENRPKRLCYALFRRIRSRMDLLSSAFYCAAYVGSEKLFRHFYHQDCETKHKSYSTELVAFSEAYTLGLNFVVKAFMDVGFMADLTDIRIYRTIFDEDDKCNHENVHRIICTLADLWEIQKQSEDAASSKNDTSPFCKILDWIANKFNSFEDATDPDPSPATKESFNLYGYVRLLWACEKWDTALVSSLVEESRIDLSGCQYVEGDGEIYQLRERIILTCRNICQYKENMKALDILSRHFGIDYVFYP
ncbi:hypothetical protein IWZ00DRAFT_298645 [Phyllosticta capitalensis]